VKIFVKVNEVHGQGWARSQNRYKKVIRYDLISIRYDMKKQLSEKYCLNFDTEIIIFFFQM
jgi:hypothetical protein